MSRVFQILVLIIMANFLTNCTDRKEKPTHLTASDSLWLQFATAMETSDLAFLLAHSMDSITCVNCEPGTSSRDERIYLAEDLFNNFLPELRHLDNLSTSKFSTFRDSASIKVNYPIKSQNAPEGGYNLIFTLEYQNGKFLLSDRFFVP